MSTNFADRLCGRITELQTPTCVGLDPDYARLPAELRERHPLSAAPDAFLEFGRGVIDAVAAWVPVMKINSAFFEAYGARGVETYFELVKSACAAGLVVIGDVKRADIGHSTEAYARGHLIGADRPDAMTVNPYLGRDGLDPFLQACREGGKGAFALVQTSNESARDVQDVRLASGETLAAHVGRLLNAWAAEPGLMGTCGYSAVGAVVSPRDVAGADTLRAILPRCVFLVPGYGAQGQSAARVAHCFKPDGTGAIVNSSRGVIYAYAEERYAAQARSGWQACVEAACRDFVQDIRNVLRS